MDLTIFKKLGLSDKETAVYLSLLEHGAVSVRELARAANLNRGTTYDILKKLQAEGLVSLPVEMRMRDDALRRIARVIHLRQREVFLGG